MNATTRQSVWQRSSYTPPQSVRETVLGCLATELVYSYPGNSNLILTRLTLIRRVARRLWRNTFSCASEVLDERHGIAVMAFSISNNSVTQVQWVIAGQRRTLSGIKPRIHLKLKAELGEGCHLLARGLRLTRTGRRLLFLTTLIHFRYSVATLSLVCF
jgi:hypothetical protein